MVNNLELQSPFLYLFGSSELGKFRIPNETNFTMYSIFAFPHFFFSGACFARVGMGL